MLRGDEAMRLIDDHELDFTDDRLESFGRDGDGQGSWCRDEDVWRLPEHPLPFTLRRITCSQSDSDLLRRSGRYRDLISSKGPMRLRWMSLQGP